MPVLTKNQRYAADTLKRLRCVRHDQLLWLMEKEYPQAPAEKHMRQLPRIGVARDDGSHYCLPGCEPDPDRVTALDVMIEMAGNGPAPIFDLPAPPCKLLFFIIRGNEMRAFRVYTPKPEGEAECLAAAETASLPPGHIAVFCVRDQNQIPLLRASRAHVFAFRGGEGGYLFERGQE